MHTKSFHCASTSELENYLQEVEQPDLIQFYANLSIHSAKKWVALLSHYCPFACRIGMSCDKQTYQGEMKSAGVTLILTYFEHTQLLHYAKPLHSDKEQHHTLSQPLFQPLNEEPNKNIPAALILTDLSQLTSSPIFQGVNQPHTLFCGGQSGYVNATESWVLYQDDLLQRHVVIVAMISDHLIAHNGAFTDMIELGKKMRITAMQGHELTQIDHLPAQQVFNRYLSNGAHTEIKTLNKFALKYKVNHTEIVSVPLQYSHTGGVIMSDPLPVGAQVKFAFFHPWPSLEHALDKLNQLYRTPPESLFIFNCISRDQGETLNPNSKLALLSQVQSINGPFCYGEFFTSKTGPKRLQHALSYLALSETPNEKRQQTGCIKTHPNDGALSAIFNLMGNAFKDMSQEKDALRHLSEHENGASSEWLYDSQTGLMNRFALLSRLQTQEEHDHKTHLSLFRIRNFRLINEQYGYDVADDLLAQLSLYLSNRMEDRFISLDFSCYRVSANEIAVLLQTDMSAQKVHQLMAELSEEVENNPFFSSSQATNVINLSLSVGIASIFDPKGLLLCKKEHLLIKASEARRHANDSNHLTFWHGDLELTDKQEDNLNWVVKIKQALEEDQVFPFIQPYFDAKTGCCVGGEALIRANINGEIVTPNRFLELIKQTQLYPKLTIKVLETCGQLLKNDPNSHLAMNLSVMDFKHKDTLNALRQFFQAHDIRDRFILEITESESIKDYQWMTSIVSEFREAGALLAIDDFGSAYSNLEKLIELQPDVLKLDASIIKRIDVDPKLEILVEHINSLAHSLDIKTQAEFVHNQAVQKRLIEMGIDYLQGFHLCEPLPIEKWNQYSTAPHKSFTELLKASS